MFNTPNQKFREKRELSPHQKQMRFFTVFFLVILLALFGLLMWLVNKSGSTP